MLELIFANIFWIIVYFFESLHDINYRTINGIEKFYDGIMFAILHIGFGLIILYYTNEFWYSFSLTVISLMVRLNFHDGLIMVLRGFSWFRLPTFDNPNDIFDKWLIKLGPAFIVVKIILYVASNVYHYLRYVDVLS